jgi:hypothetical protein
VSQFRLLVDKDCSTCDTCPHELLQHPISLKFYLYLNWRFGLGKLGLLACVERYATWSEIQPRAAVNSSTYHRTTFELLHSISYLKCSSGLKIYYWPRKVCLLSCVRSYSTMSQSWPAAAVTSSTSPTTTLGLIHSISCLGHYLISISWYSQRKFCLLPCVQKYLTWSDLRPYSRCNTRVLFGSAPQLIWFKCCL